MSAFMGLVIPTLGTAGTGYATSINNALTTIDAHDHSNGKGAPVIITKFNTVNKTTSYALLTTDSGRIITNVGAGGATTFTLPAQVNAAGCWFGFLNLSGSGMVIQAQGGDKIYSNNSASSANGTMTSGATSGADAVWLFGLSSLAWATMAPPSGSWTLA